MHSPHCTQVGRVGPASRAAWSLRRAVPRRSSVVATLSALARVAATAARLAWTAASGTLPKACAPPSWQATSEPRACARQTHGTFSPPAAHGVRAAAARSQCGASRSTPLAPRSRASQRWRGTGPARWWWTFAWTIFPCEIHSQTVRGVTWPGGANRPLTRGRMLSPRGDAELDSTVGSGARESLAAPFRAALETDPARYPAFVRACERTLRALPDGTSAAEQVRGGATEGGTAERDAPLTLHQVATALGPFCGDDAAVRGEPPAVDWAAFVDTVRGVGVEKVRAHSRRSAALCAVTGAHPARRPSPTALSWTSRGIAAARRRRRACCGAWSACLPGAPARASSP